jgi:hypothetical protein
VNRFWIVCTLQSAKFRKVLSYLNWQPAGNSTFQLGTQNEGTCLTFAIRLRITSIMQCNLIMAVLDTTMYLSLTSQISLCTTPIPQAHQRHYRPGIEEPFSRVCCPQCDDPDLSCHVTYVNCRVLVEGLHCTIPSHTLIHTHSNCYKASIQKKNYWYYGITLRTITTTLHIAHFSS